MDLGRVSQKIGKQIGVRFWIIEEALRRYIVLLEKELMETGEVRIPRFGEFVLSKQPPRKFIWGESKPYYRIKFRPFRATKARIRYHKLNQLPPLPMS